jgi:hypothetical protein
MTRVRNPGLDPALSRRQLWNPASMSLRPEDPDRPARGIKE